MAISARRSGTRLSGGGATEPFETAGGHRGHRTLRIVGKGNKPATVPFVPRTARTIDLAVGEGLAPALEVTPVA
jgi:hypothetical protein